MRLPAGSDFSHACNGARRLGMLWTGKLWAAHATMMASLATSTPTFNMGCIIVASLKDNRNEAGVAHTDVSLRVNRRSGALPRDSSSTFGVWVGEFSGSLSARRQMPVDVPPPQLLVAFSRMRTKTPYKLVEAYESSFSADC